MQELWHLISLQLHPQLLNCLRGYRHEQEEKEENLKDARMCGILITCWNWLNVRSPESPFSKTTNVFNADSSTDGSTLVWRMFSEFKQIPYILGLFSAPGSKPSSSFAVSYPLQFPLILGRSNLFLNLWQVQFVNNFSKAAKVIGTKTSQADQQFQGFSDPLKCPVDIAGVLFLTLSFWQLFVHAKIS